MTAGTLSIRGTISTTQGVVAGMIMVGASAATIQMVKAVGWQGFKLGRAVGGGL